MEVHTAEDPWTKYTYDEADRLIRVDQMKADFYQGSIAIPYFTTYIDYDLAGRKIHMDDPDMGEWYYSYDVLGNLIEQTDANGVEIAFTYDDLGRLETKTYDTSASPEIVSPGNVSYFYDEGGALANAWGQRTSMSDTTGVTTWSYDERGRVTEVTRDMNLVAPLNESFSFSYTYNKANRVVNTKYPDGEIVTNHYTENGMPESLTSILNPGPNQQAFTYVNNAHYDVLGRMTNLSLGNGLETTYDYYAFSENNLYDGRLKSVTVGEGLLNLTYDQYDAVGNIIQITDRSSNVGALNAYTLNYAYDDLSRLTHATSTGGNLDSEQHPIVPNDNFSYSYNEKGLLQTKEGDTLSYGDDAHPHAATQLGSGPDANTYQ